MQLTPELLNILFGATLTGIFGIIGIILGAWISYKLENAREKKRDRKYFMSED